MKVGLITRCKDEFFVEEFAHYYLSQGVDSLYIIDDDSNDKTIYKNLLTTENVTVVYGKHLTKSDYVNQFYKSIREKYDWIIYVDVDEFITAKRHPKRTIRQELETTFKNAHCIKVPWVMMSCNGLEKSPESVLKTNIHRWNHDLRHENKLSTHRKFRCRYEKIEVKCIFKPHFFNDLWDHYPRNPVEGVSIEVVESIDNQPDVLNPFYFGLREYHIARGFLLCYHYRIISLENSKNKLSTNQWYKDDGYDIQDLMSTDYPEIIDTTLAEK